jgi:hypothetical protein
MEALVKLEGRSTGFMHIIEKSWLYGLTVFNGKIAVDFGTTWWYSTYTMPLEKWTYLCSTYDGRTIRLFANGIQVDSSPYIASSGQLNWGLGIGNSFDPGFDIPLKGSIDEVRISNKARSASEIKTVWRTIAAQLPR